MTAILIKLSVTASEQSTTSVRATAASVYKLPEVAVHQRPQLKRGSNKEPKTEMGSCFLLQTTAESKEKEKMLDDFDGAEKAIHVTF